MTHSSAIEATDAVHDFASITEAPSLRATREQISMLHTRYRLAAQRAAGADVLEVACGTGIGLGALSRAARTVVGLDIDETNLRRARESYASVPNVSLLHGNAERLPFARASIDLVLMYEAIYYLSEPMAFLREARRVLRPTGTLLVASVNPHWSGFAVSPFSTKYPCAPDLARWMNQAGFETSLLAGFPDRPRGVTGRLVAGVRHAAVHLHLMPKTMKGKEVLKRLFYGPLSELPLRVEIDDSLCAPLVPIEASDEHPPFKVLYAIGTPHKAS